MILVNIFSSSENQSGYGKLKVRPKCGRHGNLFGRNSGETCSVQKRLHIQCRVPWLSIHSNLGVPCLDAFIFVLVSQQFISIFPCSFYSNLKTEILRCDSLYKNRNILVNVFPSSENNQTMVSVKFVYPLIVQWKGILDSSKSM